MSAVQQIVLRVFGTRPGGPPLRNGAKMLRRMGVTHVPASFQYYYPPTVPAKLLRFHESEADLYWKTKQEELKAEGISKPKKGQGKRAKKRK